MKWHIAGSNTIYNNTPSHREHPKKRALFLGCKDSYLFLNFCQKINELNLRQRNLAKSRI